MAQVLYKKAARDYLYHLVDVLIDEHYFSYEEDALSYVKSIYFFFEQNIPTSHVLGITKELRGNLLKKHGRYCRAITYKINGTTTWCAVYSTSNNIYLVHAIFNNHVREYNDVVFN